MQAPRTSHIASAIFLTMVLTIFRISASDYRKIYDLHKNTPLEDLCEMGEKHLAENHRDSALLYFTMVRMRLPYEKDSEQSKTFAWSENSIGIISFMNADYTDAYACFRRVLESSDEPVWSAIINMAGIYHYLGDDKKSADLLRQVIHSAISADDAASASIAVSNLMSLGFTVDQPDKISEYRQDLEAYIDKFKNDSDRSVCYTIPLAKAMLSVDNMNWPEAIHHLRESLLFTDSMLLPQRNIISSEFAIGNCFLRMNSADSAIRHIDNAERIAMANGYHELINEALGYYSEAYRRKGDMKLSHEYRYRFLQMKDSLFSQKDLNRIHDLDTSYEIDKFERELNRLNAEKRYNTRFIIIISVTMIIILAMLVIVLRQYSLLKGKNRNLYDKYVMMLREKDSIRVPVVEKDEDAAEEKKYSGSPLNDSLRDDLKNRISDIMCDEQTVCEDSFSLAKLASACGSNSTYVSQVLNEDFGKSFSRMVNEKRVEIICRRLMDTDSYGQLTIEAISAGAGFKSRSNFSRTFKSITGLTPTEFLKLARSGNKVVI